jgi:diphthamide synthase (EF-2-diphthine--ammonia ligase)
MRRTGGDAWSSALPGGGPGPVAGLALEAVFLGEKAGNDAYDRAIAAILGKYRRSGFSGIAFGDLHLEEIRRYRESRLAGSGMVPLFPLWGKDTRALAERFVEDGWRALSLC